MNLEPSVVRWITQQRSEGVGPNGAARVGSDKVATPGDAVAGGEPEGLASAIAELRRYVDAVQNVPTLRAERVAALRAAIAEGSYTVPIDTLAAKLVGNG